MLDSLFRSLCRPADAPMELEPGIVMGIWAILAAAVALPAAGTLDVGGFGAFGLSLVAFGGFLAAWFWTGAAMTLLARLAGGRGTAESTLGALAQAAWPLLLMPAVLSLDEADWLPGGEILPLALMVWIALLGVAFVRRVHGLSWGKAVLAWITFGGVSVLTVLCGGLACGLIATLLLG